MADNVTITESGSTSVAADEISSVKYQRIKVVLGADGVNDGDVSSGNPMPIVAASLPLPSGAATSANQSTQITALNAIQAAVEIMDDWDESDRAKVNIIVGQAGVQGGSGTVSANTQRVVLATDVALPSGSNTIGTVNSIENGFSNVEFVRNDYSSVNVTTSAYVELIASTSNAYKEVEIFDSSGQTLKLAFGAAASEIDKILVFPGGNSRIKLAVPAATRISIKAVSATASVGEVSINLFG